MHTLKAYNVIVLQHCNPDHHRVQRDVSYHDTVMLSLGPLVTMPGKYQGRCISFYLFIREWIDGLWFIFWFSCRHNDETSTMILLVIFLTATTLTL